MTANPVIIRYLPWWFSVLAALGAAALFIVCAQTLLDGIVATRRFSQWYGLVIMVLGLVCSGGVIGLAIAELLKPTRLVVTGEGFSQVGLWALSIIPWKDVERFELHTGSVRTHMGWSLPITKRFACYRLKDEARGRASRWRRWVAPGDSDGVLASGFGKLPETVVKILSERHQTDRL